jgi:hypothetical protein
VAKIEYEWYVEPLDSYTNSVFGEQLSDYGERLCDDGRNHPLWPCPKETLLGFVRSRRQLSIKFHIFNRVADQNHSVICRDVTSLYIKKQKRRLSNTNQQATT